MTGGSGNHVLAIQLNPNNNAHVILNEVKDLSNREEYCTHGLGLGFKS